MQQDDIDRVIALRHRFPCMSMKSIGEKVGYSYEMVRLTLLKYGIDTVPGWFTGGKHYRRTFPAQFRYRHTKAAVRNIPQQRAQLPARNRLLPAFVPVEDGYYLPL